MKISLIVCTYMRPKSLSNLLDTVEKQLRKPDEVIIVDGSTDDKTKEMIENENFNLNLMYYKVSESQRGLTKQRNYGVKQISNTMDIVAFLDDDVELDVNYFSEIEKVYLSHSDAIAVGGISTNEVKWEKSGEENDGAFGFFTYDGWSRREDIRYRVRKKLGLISKQQPGLVCSFGHERSIGFLPPTGKIYETDFLMGGIASYKKEIFQSLSFSSFFEGYGLYEDKDFSLRSRRYGKIYINTSAKVEHHHDPLGRPNYVKYGKMVVWNGWRVWRVATPTPSLSDKVKWWSVTLLLTYVRLGNALVGPERKIALEDFVGRHLGMLKLVFSHPDMSDI